MEHHFLTGPSTLAVSQNQQRKRVSSRWFVTWSVCQAPFEGVLGLALPVLAEGSNFSFIDELVPGHIEFAFALPRLLLLSQTFW